MKHDFNELRLDRVTRRFAGAGGHAFAALNELTLTIKRGEFIALLGPSGCGKSTALNCIAGLLPLSGGTILNALVSMTGRALGMKPVSQTFLTYVKEAWHGRLVRG